MVVVKWYFHIVVFGFDELDAIVEGEDLWISVNAVDRLTVTFHYYS